MINSAWPAKPIDEGSWLGKRLGALRQFRTVTPVARLGGVDEFDQAKAGGEADD